MPMREPTRLSDEEMEDYARLALKNAPRVGSVWKHHDGRGCQVIVSSLRELDHEPLVTYFSFSTRSYWTRPLREFLGPALLGGDGKPIPRFTPDPSREEP
jgi:hypothetical protein